MKSTQIRRISKIKKLLRKESHRSALLLSSSPHRIRTGDNPHSFRQSSNFFYLTESYARGLLLLITAEEKELPVLFAPPVNEAQIIWEGKPESARTLARSIGAEYLEYKDTPASEVLLKLKGYEQLFFEQISDSPARRVADSLISRPVFEKPGLPRVYVDADYLMQELRLFKDREELDKIIRAAEITAEGMMEALIFMNPQHREYQVAASIDWWFRMQRGEPAFDTIVAGGVSAATLHYSLLQRGFRTGDSVLIDCGAELDLYAADISRVLPVGGRFQGASREIYTAVLEAQHAAIGKIADGVKLESVFNAAARALTIALVDLGVLRGSVSKNLAKRAYKKFFPHGIGHSLGMDVHDIGSIRGNNKATLKEGMVLTVEPGLYFPQKTGSIPPSGFRIEDDVVVTKNGCRILTTHFPKELTEVEELVGRANP